MFVSFNYSPDQQGEPLCQVFLHPEQSVPWKNKLLDAAVLQLQLMPSHPLPPPLGHLHGDASCSKTLYLIGHDNHADNNLVVDLHCPVKKFSSLPDQFLQDNSSDYFDMSDPRRTLLVSSLTHGSSGSPGFDQHNCLTVMYTKGYPSKKPQVEQAVNIVAIKNQLVLENHELAERLFN